MNSFKFGKILFGLFCALVLSGSHSVFAQGWQWGRESAGTGNKLAHATASDFSGNIYECGSYSDSMLSFSSITLTNAGGQDIYIAKYNTLGNVIWAVHAGGTGNDVAQAITTDVDGNIYIAGYFESDTAWFGTAFLVNTGIRKAYVAKYDPSGNVIWVKAATGAGSDEVNALVTDGAGNVYAAGRFSDIVIAIDTFSLTNTSTDTTDNLFLAKINSSGITYWMRQGRGNGVEATAMSITPSGNLVLTGYFGGSAIFGTSTTLTSAGGKDLFVSSWTNGGGFLWAQSAGGTGDEMANAIAVDDSGKIWIGGGFTSPSLTIAGRTLTNSGSMDLLLAKLDASGNFYRAQSAGGSDSDYVTALTTGANEALFAAGNYKSGSLALGSSTLTNSGTENLFLFKADSAGNILLYQNNGGTGAEKFAGMCRDTTGNIFLTGTLTSPLFYFGFSGMTNSGVAQTFLAKFNDTSFVPGPISGAGSLCVGTTLTLGNPVSEGVWSISNPAVAAIDASSGLVTGISAGTDTVSYTIHGFTTTAIITIDTLLNPGIITGASVMCMYNPVTFTDTVAGGTWYSSGVHTSVTSVGIVTGVNAGLDTVKYIMSNSCGPVAATKPVTINSSPVLAPISGVSAVCTGTAVTLSEFATGGSWAASNSHASVNSGGVVLGTSVGIDTIRYSKTNGICTTTVTQVITVNTTPSAGTITGVSSLCVGVSDTFADTATSGTWGSLSPSKLSVTATGVATGISGGVAFIGYTAYNACGAATATKIITVLALSNPGVITGFGTICVGVTDTLTDTISGGVWSVTNATLSDSAGFITGVATGVDTVMYTTTNVCGSQSATRIITVNALPIIAPITGATGLCLGDSTLLADSSSGGVWSASNSLATVSGGMVVSLGITTGVDTIYYTLTNICGSVSASVAIHIDVIPSPATIMGADSMCAGSSSVYSNSVPGGTWSDTNPWVGLITDSLLTSVFGGYDTLLYTIANGCATVFVSKVIHIIPSPVAGFIAGPDTVCISGSIELYPSNPGGTWTMTNGNATDTGAWVYGMAVGFDTVVYTLSNFCGSDFTTKSLYVKPLPTVDAITGALRMCIHATLTLADDSYPGYWSAANGNASVADGVVHSLAAGTDTIIYTHTDLCGLASATVVVTMDPLPNPGSISGQDTLCVGDSVQLIASVPGGVWSNQLSSVASLSGGVPVPQDAAVTGLLSGTDSVLYTVSNACGSAYIALGIQVVTPVIPLVSIGTIACIGGINDTLIAYPTTGIWTTSNFNVSITSTPYGIVATGVSVGADTLVYVLTEYCGVYRDTTVIMVGQIIQPSITGPTSVCVGKSDTLIGTPFGGIWSSSDTLTNLYGSSVGLVATGHAAGSEQIFYTLTGICGSSTDSTMLTIYSKAYCDSVNEVPNVPTILGHLNVYPNPTSGIVQIETGSNKQVLVSVFDMLGRKIHFTEISGNANFKIIDLSGNAPGNYVLEVSVDGVVERMHVVLEGR